MALKTSAAVKIAAPQRNPRPSKHSSAPHVVPQSDSSRRARRQSMRSATMRVVKFVAAFVCVMVMIALLVFERANTIKYNLEKAQAERDLAAAKSETVRLESQFNGMVSVENVEQYATEKLGMVKRATRQMQFFKNQNSDEIVLINPLDP